MESKSMLYLVSEYASNGEIFGKKSLNFKLVILTDRLAFFGKLRQIFANVKHLL